MGKIFGISDLPVSTIHKAIKGTHFEPVKRVATTLQKEQKKAIFFLFTTYYIYRISNITIHNVKE